MRTEEDEAFDEIARKQGAWGGGFKAKQAMAADKVQDETDMLTIAYLDGYERGKKAALAQPAQEPHEYDWSMLEAAKESLREHMARIKELEAALAQPAQEPEREALKLALITLEGWDNHDKWVWPETALEQAKRNTKEAIASIKEALAQPPLPVQPERLPLTDEAKAVIAAAKVAINASFETENRELDISIPAHLATALSLRLDEFEAAHNIGDKS